MRTSEICNPNWDIIAHNKKKEVLFALHPCKESFPAALPTKNEEIVHDYDIYCQ
jgi:hypothetical protein